ncbi:hypothetical protein [Gracilimonas sp.]|uniref:hypothetical protein n=1 Tax=Gracilimonas sp. TaxID=1974203 RepID=UPI003BAD6CC2
MTPEEYFLNTSLYSRFSLEDLKYHRFALLVCPVQPIKSTCLICNEESVFKPIDIKSSLNKVGTNRWVSVTSTQNYSMIDPDIMHEFKTTFSCTYCNVQKLVFYSLVYKNSLQKIGQSPSYADLNFNGLNKYKKFLGEYFNEYKRAIGLASSEIGIGSFVYLRRIIEKKILGYAVELANEKEKDFDLKEYNDLYFKDKVNRLKEYLPTYLIENTHVYSILSKGIHELSEQECNRYFSVLIGAIEHIMDDAIAKENARKKREEIQKKLNEINSDLT